MRRPWKSLWLFLFLMALLIGSGTTRLMAQGSPTPDAGTPQGVTLGERVNADIDNLLALGNRMLELPLFMLLAGAGLLCLLLMLAAKALVKKEKHQRLGRAMRVATVAILVLAFAFVEDHKIAQLQDAVNELRARTSSDTISLLNAAGQKESAPATQPPIAPPANKTIAKPAEPPVKPVEVLVTANPPKDSPKEAPKETLKETPKEVLQAAAKRTAFLFNEADANKALKQQFGQAGARPLIYDQATDVVQLHITNPLVQAYLAIVNLKYPGVEVKLGGSMSEKTLTSTFAKANDCTLAINGEAGVSPRPGSGLGEWRGNMVKLGQVLSRENAGIPRPYLSFDKQNHVTFTAAAVKDRTLAADSYNVMWGRLDAVIDGVVQTADERNRQPRTGMGISKDGTILYLLVVDGRQPNYSMGFTRAEVGHLLKAYGAYNGMLCDEGGSSCIYLKKLGGISNIPSDNQGAERVTYTHFGISLHETQ